LRGFVNPEFSDASKTKANAVGSVTNNVPSHNKIGLRLIHRIRLKMDEYKNFFFLLDTTN